MPVLSSAFALVRPWCWQRGWAGLGRWAVCVTSKSSSYSSTSMCRRAPNHTDNAMAILLECSSVVQATGRAGESRGLQLVQGLGGVDEFLKVFQDGDELFIYIYYKGEQGGRIASYEASVL